MAHHQPVRESTTEAGEIPDKLYFRIGEVARLCEVPTYVLRFWETEFPHLKPNKGGTGQRLFRRRDVEMALRIKRLLYDEGYTIPGARQLLRGEQRHKDPQLLLAVEEPRREIDRDALMRLRQEMAELLAILSPGPGRTAGSRRPQSQMVDNLFDFGTTDRAERTRQRGETDER